MRSGTFSPDLRKKKLVFTIKFVNDYSFFIDDMLFLVPRKFCARN